MEFFGQKWPNFGCFWPKKGQFWIFDKKTKWPFFTFIKPRPHEKNQKNLMRQFENMSKKHWFWAVLAKNGQFWTIFGQKRASFVFSAKKRNCHFLAFMDPLLHEKKQKILMRGFLRKSVRTDVRTDVQAWIHRSPRFLETNKPSFRWSPPRPMYKVKNMRILWEIGPNEHFSVKMANFWPKNVPKILLSKL